MWCGRLRQQLWTSGLPEAAVEWLEQGRSIVWGELFQLRSSFEGLSSAHSDHARRLQELSAALEQASATREKSSVHIFGRDSKRRRIVRKSPHIKRLTDTVHSLSSEINCSRRSGALLVSSNSSSANSSPTSELQHTQDRWSYSTLQKAAAML
jgi:hypothetical protein